VVITFSEILKEKSKSTTTKNTTEQQQRLLTMVMMKLYKLRNNQLKEKQR